MLLPEYPRGSVGKENAVLTTGILPGLFSEAHRRKKYGTWSWADKRNSFPVNHHP